MGLDPSSDFGLVVEDVDFFTVGTDDFEGVEFVFIVLELAEDGDGFAEADLGAAEGARFGFDHDLTGAIIEDKFIAVEVNDFAGDGGAAGGLQVADGGLGDRSWVSF